MWATLIFSGTAGLFLAWTISALWHLRWVRRLPALAHSANAGAAQTAFIFTAILLHGACYDFLFIAGQLYVDDEANERIRGACQGFIAFILWGVGAFVGTMLAGKVLGKYALTDAAGKVIGHDWQKVWLTPAWLAIGVLVIFLIFFRNPPKKGAANVIVNAGDNAQGTT